MNREDVAMDVTVQNVEILRKEVQAAKLLLSECDKVIEEDGGVYIELRAFLSGKIDADEVIALLASQQGEQCKACGGTGMVDDGEIWCSEGGIPYENGPVKCAKECPSCTGKHAEQAEGAHVPDDVFEAEFMTWWEDEGQYCRSGGGDYERTFAFQAWRHLYPQLIAARAALAQPSPAPELERPRIMGYATETDGLWGLSIGRRTEMSTPLIGLHEYDRIVGALRAEVQRWHEASDEAMQLNIASRKELRAAIRERDAAQARVAELERERCDLRNKLASANLRWSIREEQESVAWVVASDGDLPRMKGQGVDWYPKDIDSLPVGTKLYAAPVAQAGQVPELDQLYSMLGADDQVDAARKIAELVGCRLSRSALTDAQMRRLYENSTEAENERLGFAAFARLMRRAEAVHQIAAAPAQGE